MTVLHTSRPNSARTARTRLESEKFLEAKGFLDADLPETAESAALPPIRRAVSDTPHSADLLMQVVHEQHDWQLVRIRRDVGQRVAFLVRKSDGCRAQEAIIEGRAMRIVADAAGNIEIFMPVQPSRFPFLNRK